MKNKEKINYNNSPELIIIRNIYSDENFKKILKITNKVDDELKSDNRCYYERKTYMFKKDNINFKKIRNIIYSSRLISILENMIKKKNKSTKFPFEYRLYDKDSQGMVWHRDKPIFDGDYYECVLTLNNKSNSKFRFIDKKGKSKFIRTTPNSLICVLPKTILHSVSPTEYGERRIIKFVVKFEDNKMNKNYKNEIINFENNFTN